MDSFRERQYLGLVILFGGAITSFLLAILFFSLGQGEVSGFFLCQGPVLVAGLVAVIIGLSRRQKYKVQSHNQPNKDLKDADWARPYYDWADENLERLKGKKKK